MSAPRFRVVSELFDGDLFIEGRTEHFSDEGEATHHLREHCTLKPTDRVVQPGLRVVSRLLNWDAEATVTFVATTLDRIDLESDDGACWSVTHEQFFRAYDPVEPAIRGH